MSLSDDLVSQFVKITNDIDEKNKGSTVYGTVKKYNGKDYVQLDGSDLLTPVTSTTTIGEGQRVTVLVQNHNAIVTGNITSPSVSTEEVDNKVSEVGSKISDFEIIIANKVDTLDFNAEKARIDNLTAENVNIKERLTASEANIGDLTADNVTINEKLTVNEANILDLKTKKLDADIADIKFATIESLDATNINVNNLTSNYGEFKDLATNKFTAIDANIEYLKTNVITTEFLDANYAHIDLANIIDGCITTAMIGTGVVGTAQIADGSITDAKIVELTANKITSGTIDAANIEVINLNAANITVGTINGQQIAPGAIDVSQLSSGVNNSINSANSNANQALRDAYDAMQEALQSNETANAALTSANGKNKNYYSATEPAGGTYVIGDIWYNTEKDNQMAHWNGTEWVIEQFGASAIEDGIITADKISNDVNIKIQNALDNAGNALTASQTAESNANSAITKVNDLENRANSGEFDGKGIDGKPTITYQSSTNGTTAPTGTWTSSIPVVAPGSYLWTKFVIKYTDGSESTVYTVGKIGNDGSKGDKGDTGKGIANITNYYIASNLSTGITTSTSGWQTSPQTVTTVKKYHWHYQVYTYTDNTSSSTIPAIIGVYGDTGTSGNAGKGITSVTPQYYLSTSNTAQTGGSWKTTQDTWASGKYYWTRDAIVWSDGTTTYTTAILATGLNNANSSASNAVSTANNANNTAQAANSNANNALTAANTAQTLANQINSIVDENKANWDKASTALDTANSALATANTAKNPDVILHSNYTAKTFYEICRGTKAYNSTSALGSIRIYGSLGGWTATNNGGIDITFPLRDNIGLIEIQQKEEVISTSNCDIWVTYDGNKIPHYYLVLYGYASAMLYVKYDSEYCKLIKTSSTTEPSETTLWKLSQNSSVVTKAQLTADGKNTVFYQTSAPSTSGRKTNDIWFDTDDGNKMYYFDGSAWTAKQFGTNAIANLSITNALIADGTIQNAKIANLDAAKITTGYLDAARIKSGTIVADHIASNAITTDKLAANAITAVKISSGAVTTDKLAASAVTAAKIAAGTITADKLVAKTITASSGVLADACIVTANIADLAVSSGKIANAAIGTAKIADLAVTNAKLANLSVTNAKIADATIENAKIKSLDAGKITTGTLDANRIAAGTISIGKLDTSTQNVINYTSIMAIASNGGKLINKDVCFADGVNKVSLYNNTSNGTTSVSRITKPTDCPSTSGYCIQIQHTGTTASPGYGGFVQSIQSRASAHFIIKYIIKLPTGYKLNTATNSMGSGYTDRWLTDNIGTGKYTEYIREVICGTTGSFSNGGHVYVTSNGGAAPTSSAPLTWYLAGIWQYDVTGADANWAYSSNETYIDGGKIYTGTVTANQLAANSIIAGKIAANAVTATTIAASAVTTDKLAASAVTAAKIAAGTITADKIVAGAITSNEIAASTITANNIASNAITAVKISSGAVTTDKLAANAVTAAKIAAGTITATQLASNAVTADKIASNAVTAAKIAAGTITADKLKVSSLSTISANIGTITSGTIKGTTIIGATVTTNESRNTYNATTLGLTMTDSGLGAGDGSKNTFYVTNTGKLYANNAEITGTIIANSAKIGKWQLDSDSGKIYWTDKFEIIEGINLSFGVCLGDDISIYYDDYSCTIDEYGMHLSTSTPIKFAEYGLDYMEFHSTSQDYYSIYNPRGIFFSPDQENSVSNFTGYKYEGISYKNVKIIDFTNSYANVNIIGTLDVTSWIEASNFWVAGAGYCVYSPNSSGVRHRVNGITFVNGSSTYLEIVANSSGANWGITAWKSDRRLKTNIELSSIKASDIINRIDHVSFDWIDGSGHVSMGYVADDLKTIIPEAVFEVGNENYKHIDNSKVIPYITKAIQEMIKEIEDLRNEKCSLEQELHNTQSKLDAFVCGNYNLKTVIREVN